MGPEDDGMSHCLTFSETKFSLITHNLEASCKVDVLPTVHTSFGNLLKPGQACSAVAGFLANT